ncbi:MAG: class I SAM-dependent methyltransferase [Gemmatimonadota bacterium]
MSRSEIQQLYRQRAKRYDLTANLYYLGGFREWHYRKVAVGALDPRPGDTVVEIGCGTGLNFGLLRKRVTAEGRIIGVDLTDAMLERARARLRRHGWENVKLVHSDAGSYAFPARVNGILSTFALGLVPEYEEVIRRGAAALAPAGRWVVADLKMPEGLARHLAPLFLPAARPFGVTLDLAERRPWEVMVRHLWQVRMREYYLGYVYVCVGERSA